ncbi:MAG TPA: hypothetical protein VK923_03745 [Euzebyales bacterium]|nr:hypothetical protein [Euzebyales bacterium]
MRAFLSPLHRGLVHLVTLAVLVQAVLAGQFVSGLNDLLGAHGAVGGIVELAGLLLFVVAIAHRIAGERSRVALWGTVGLAVALQVQAGLGWAPGALPTAIHVPLGVGIFAGAVALSGSIGRSLTTGTPDRWQGGAEHARTAMHS